MERARTANELWSGLLRGRSAERYLMVFSETVRPHKHVGFWVPIVDGLEIPGAPVAMENLLGDMVRKASLPPLRGWPPSVAKRWRRYIEQEVHGDSFVCLPLIARASANEPPRVVCVININVRGAGWYRAAHAGWLDRARRAIAPHAELAHLAATVLVAFGDSECKEFAPQLVTTAVEDYDSFPGLRVAAQG